ncbi:hypothetical protein PR001_g14979 [Phytophthora rubi]|uniref:Uncharacterized protein n=1 Tax=Phytophthora rubi TaxID=129364 RepID=A0A6A3KQK4_9STRA|nr:hypothetical protein PR002_g15685 [Phytophthora rubi]KAE9015120.1 hypothetical protein PR001_g14979 [Phytophthora rubi]
MDSDTSTTSSPVGVQRGPKKRCKTDKDPTPDALWEAVVQEQWRREQQRQRMVRWRQQKKKKATDMVLERRRLEKELQRRVLKARMVTDGVTPESFEEALRLMMIERAALTREKLVLLETIAEHVKFQTVLDNDAQELMRVFCKDSTPTTAVVTEPKTNAVPLLQDEGGWRVTFPNGESSFHFQPFSPEEFEGLTKRNDVVHTKEYPSTAVVGVMFGWKVEYAPLTRNPAGTAFVAHARFTRRVRCSIDCTAKILPRLDKSLWPKPVAPKSWGLVQTGSFSCQVLQQFHKNAHAMVCNIPGEVNLRYLALAQHTRGLRSDGRRMDKYMLDIVDTKANARNREAEGSQDNVQWILEGGVCTTITEADSNTVDVVYDHWAGCLSEVHGRKLSVLHYLL